MQVRPRTFRMNQPATIDAVAKPPRRRKLLFRVLWSLFALVVGVCLFWTYSYYSALWERDALIAEIRAKGEPVWWEEVADDLLSRSWKGTGADKFRQACFALGWPINPNGQKLPMKAVDDELKGKELDPMLHTGVQNLLALSDEALKATYEAVELPPGLIITRLHSAEPVSIILDETQRGRSLQRLLHWRSFDSLAKGRLEEAFKAAWTSLALSEQYLHEPFAISHVVRLYLFGKGIEQLGMCLKFGSPMPTEFERIDALLRKREYGFELDAALLTERSMWFTSLNQPSVVWILGWNGRRISSRGPLSNTVSRWWSQLVASPIGNPILTRGQAEYLVAFSRLAPEVEQPDTEPATVLRFVERHSRESILHRSLDTEEDFGVRSLYLMIKRCQLVHRQIVFARLALRLRRYFDRRGRLPEKLDDLCDATMPKIRLEWFQNQPIVYKPRANGFRLELPESIVPPEARYRLSETPILSDYGLEIEFKTVKKGSPK
jgi:hypothetical protein